MANNKCYKSIKDTIVTGKSSIGQENFNVFVFAVRDIEIVTIPNSEH